MRKTLFVIAMLSVMTAVTACSSKTAPNISGEANTVSVEETGEDVMPDGQTSEIAEEDLSPEEIRNTNRRMLERLLASEENAADIEELINQKCPGEMIAEMQVLGDNTVSVTMLTGERFAISMTDGKYVTIEEERGE